MNKKIQMNKQIESYFRWPLIYLAFLFILTLILFYINITAGIISLAFLLVAVAVSFFIGVVSKRHLMSEVINYALTFGTLQKNFLQKFQIPYILLDIDGRIRWFNEEFETMIGEKKILDKNINALIPHLNSTILPVEDDTVFEKEISLEDKIYRVIIRSLEIDDDNTLDAYDRMSDSGIIYATYFFDITNEKELQTKNDDQKTVVGLLYIDNYEEAFQSIEDVRRPLLVALIDRNINKFAKKIDGVVRKFEKDKYMIIFQKKYLRDLHEDKFAILDVIREINIGNELPVTLSMGLGVNDYSYIQSMDFARVAIDLALGRGGDQAVIKESDKFLFYGGKTRGVEKSARVKARIKAYAFRELIEDCDKVIVMGHKVQDLDSLGAAIGIYSCARLLDKPVHIVLNEITSAVRPLYERFIEDDNYGEDLFIDNVEAVNYANENTLLVVVDVNRPSYTECEELFKYVNNVVVFDHHRVGAEHIENTVLSYIEPYASSACEMVTEIIRYISDKVKLRPMEAEALFAGITVDTKNFVIKTGVKTFEAAAYLRRNGADVVRVRKLFKNDMESYKARATAVRDSEIYRDKMAISICPSDIQNPILVTAQAADELLNISGIKASFVLTNVDGIIYISARSFDDINVQLIMEKLGGGGHLSVAGAQLHDNTIDGAIEILKDTIDEYLEEGEKK
ncbi:DHH family phosphoesterase [Vallitalea guaymasensis]|uniref:Cyclic-di-AMP phosphodiesterase n=1 Tax=Vallitalea guaymasensis TaxID=1185412 RepID=A0A8J8SC61_9FIRM|nr:DHH family phosphoesterase [Vallitalea guaymasensis]QUH29483.1 DHH family phosphoesterase [Vallitalea guaymasensis]